MKSVKSVKRRVVIPIIIILFFFLIATAGGDKNGENSGENSGEKIENQFGSSMANAAGDETDDQIAGPSKGSVSILAEHRTGINSVVIKITGSALIGTITYELESDGTRWSGIISGIPVGENFSAAACAYDGQNELVYRGQSHFSVAGNHVVTSRIILYSDVETQDESVPVIENVTAFPQKTGPGEAAALEVNIKDMDNPDQAFTYLWESEEKGSFDDPSSPTPLWTSPMEGGLYPLKVTVTNSEGRQANQTITIEVDSAYTVNSIPVELQSYYYCWYYYFAPRIKAISAQPRIVEKGGTVSLNVDAYDRFGARLYYKWYTCTPGSFDNRYVSNPEFTVSKNARSGYYRVKVYVWNRYYCTTACVTIKVVESSNNPPVITAVTAQPPELAGGESTNLSVAVSDADGDVLTYSWQTNCPGSFNDASAFSPRFTAGPGAENGTYGVLVTVSDGKTSVTGKGSIRIKNSNNPPVIDSVTADPVSLERNETTALTVIAFDPDQDSLSYSWSSDCKGSFDDSSRQNPVFTVAGDAEYGSYTIQVVVSDGKDSVTGVAGIVVKQANRPPVIQNIKADPLTLDRTESCALEITAADPDGDSLQYSWSTSCPGSFDDPAKTDPVFTVAGDAPYAVYTIYVEVSDGALTVSSSISITVAHANRPPIIYSVSADPEELDKNQTTQLQVSAIDIEGEALTYIWSTDCPGSFDDPAKSNPAFTVGSEAGFVSYIISVAVSDGVHTTVGSVTITVSDTNKSPRILGLVADPTRIIPGEETRLKVSAMDPDNNELTYTWSSNCPGTFNNTGSTEPTFILDPVVSDPTCKFTVQVTDGNEVVTGAITINVGDVNTNRTPEIISSFQTSDYVEAGAELIFKIRARDPEEAPLTFEWSASQGILGTPVESQGAGYTESLMIWRAPAGSDTQIVIKVVVKDDHNLSVKKEFIPVRILSGVTGNTNPVVETKLDRTNKEPNQMYGLASAIDNTYGVIAGRTANLAGQLTVYELDEQSSNWQEAAVLQPFDVQANDYFGASVSISGNVIAAGASGEDGGPGDPVTNCGAVYIFERTQGIWEEKARLYSSDQGATDKFGTSVSLSGDYLIAGAMYEDGGPENLLKNSGAAYVFKKDLQGGWQQTAVLRAPDGKKNDYFGCAVSINGEFAVVGARGVDLEGISNTGTAYLFKKNTDESWSFITVLKAPDGQEGDKFGQTLAIGTGHVIIGAEYENGGTGDPESDAGAVYIFSLDEQTGNWYISSILHAPDRKAADYFGCSVSLYKNIAVIGARGRDHRPDSPVEGSGAVYVYELKSNGVWTVAAELFSPEAAPDDNFGYSAGISENYGIIGARQEDGGEGDPVANTGAGYIFKLR